MQVRGDRQRGQALLLVLAFLAVFLVFAWAALALASGSFLGLSSVQADTKSTYALDAGVDFGIQYVKGITPCASPVPAPPVLTVGSTTVSLTISVAAGCKTPAPVYDLLVTASGTWRKHQAEIAQVKVGATKLWTVNWETYQ